MSILAPETAQTRPFVREFFRHALEGGTLAHAYLFKGRQMKPMYETALWLAQVLNCTDRPAPAEACGACQNCRWITRNAHPAVLTVSRLTQLDEESFKKVAKTRKPLTQISTNQIAELLGQLARSSEYCRVIIFTDLEEVPEAGHETLLPPAEWRNMPGNEERHLRAIPLNRKILNPHSANRMLKTLEEPSPNTLFIFLSDSEESMLDTIVSRCQTLPFVFESQPETEHLLGAHCQFLDRWVGLLQPDTDFYEMTDELRRRFETEHGLTPLQTLDVLQRYFRQSFHADFPSNGQDSARFRRYTDRIRQVEQARKMLIASTNTDQVISQTVYALCQV